MADALGTVPAVTIAAGLTLPRRKGKTAVEIAGALQLEPPHLVRAEDSDLLVPASSEVVLEGVLLPGELARARPFTPRFSYRGTAAGLAPVFEVRTITGREQPVVAFSSWGTPIGDSHIVGGLAAAVQLKQAFAAKGWPVTDVFTPP